MSESKAGASYSPFYTPSARAEAMAADLVGWALAAYGGKGLARDLFALTLLPFDRPLAGGAAGQPEGHSFHGDQLFYPCSVVKLFYLAAAEARLEAGALTPHGELDRAMHDMIRWSSNTATNYIIDLVTGTTGWEAELPRITGLVEARNGALLHAANFSIGVQLFLRAARALGAEFAGREGFDGFIVEEHHASKRDAPSGTARALR